MKYNLRYESFFFDDGPRRTSMSVTATFIFNLNSLLQKLIYLKAYEKNARLVHKTMKTYNNEIFSKNNIVLSFVDASLNFINCCFFL